MANGNVNIGVNVQTNGQAGLNQLNQALNNLTNSANKLGSASSGITTFFSGLAQTAGAVGGIYALKEAIGGLITTAQELDKVKSQLNFTNGGNARQTAQDLKYVRDEALRLGVDLKSTAEGFAKFKVVATQQGWNNQEMQNFFSGFSEFAVVMGASKEDLKGSFKAFEQMLSKGKVSAEELRLQLGDRFPAAVPIFAQALGKSTAEMNKLLEKGQLSADILKQVGYVMSQLAANELATATGNMRANIARLETSWELFKQSLADDGFKRKVSNIAESLSNALNGGLFDPLVKGSVDALTSLLEWITKWAVQVLAGFNKLALEIARVFTNVFAKVQGYLTEAQGKKAEREAYQAEKEADYYSKAGDKSKADEKRKLAVQLRGEASSRYNDLAKLIDENLTKNKGFDAFDKAIAEAKLGVFKQTPTRAKQGDPKAKGLLAQEDKAEADKQANALRAYGKALEEANTQRLRAMHDAEKALLDQHYAERLIGEREYQEKLSALQLEAYADELGNLQNHRQQITSALAKEKDSAKQLALQGDLVRVDAKIFEVEKKVESEPIRLKTKLVGIEESLAQARAQIEAELLTIKGFQGAGALAQLDERQRQFNRQNVGNPEQIALYAELINLQKQKVQLDEQERAFSETNQFYKLREQELNAKAVLGLTTQREVNRTLRAEREAMIPVLEETIRKYEEMAQAMPDNAELKLKVQGMRVSLLELKGQADELDKAMNDAFANGIVKGIDEVINKTKSLGDVLKGILVSIVNSFAQIMAKRFVDSAIGGGGIFTGIGKLLGFADGGYVSGPGTSRSDSIPAWLSNGEFVLNAQAVSYWGTDFLHSLNAPKFADGGLVGGGGAGGSGGGIGGTSVYITNTISNEDIANSMNSRPGEQAILNVIQRNAGTVKQVIR